MKKVFLYATTFAVIGMMGLTTSCKKDEEKPDPTPATLYSKVGGETKVADPSNPGQMIEKGRLSLRAVVDSSIFVIAADPQLQPYFATLLGEVGSGDLTGFAALSKNFTDFFCVATGAKNYNYTGLNMVDTHDPAKNGRMAMKTNNADFDKFVGDIVIGAQKNGVPNDIIQEVGALLETTRSAVVQR